MGLKCPGIGQETHDKAIGWSSGMGVNRRKKKTDRLRSVWWFGLKVWLAFFCPYAVGVIFLKSVNPIIPFFFKIFYPVFKRLSIVIS